MENQILREFLKRPIAYQPIVAKAFGSVKLGIFWSQLYYWNDRTKDDEGWIYKTQAEIYEETGLSRREQETARKIGRQLGVLEEKIAKHPATVHFRIDAEKAGEIIEKFVEDKYSGQKKLIDKDWKKADKNTGSIAYLNQIADEDLKELSEKYEVDIDFVKARAEDVIDYCEAKGKSYRDYKAALRNFIKTHLKQHPEARKQYLTEKQKQEKKKEIDDLQKKEARTPDEQERINKRLDQMRAELGEKLTAKK